MQIISFKNIFNNLYYNKNTIYVNNIMPTISKQKQKNKQKQYQPISLVNQSPKIQINNKKYIIRWVYICIIIGFCIGILINVYMIIQNNHKMGQEFKQMFGNINKTNKQYKNADSINTMTVIQQIVQQNILNNKIQHITPNIPTTNNNQQQKQYHIQITNQQQSEIQHQPIHQLTPNSQIQKQQLIKQRIKLGQPKLPQRQLAYILIQGNPRSHICTLINTVNILTQTSIKTGKYLLQNLHINTLLYIIDNNDQFVDELINKQFIINKIKKYQFQIDSDYRFIRVIVGYRQCQKIMYLSNNFNILKKNSKILEDIIGRNYNLNVYYTPTAMSNKIQQKLVELNKINLQTLQPAYFNKYIYVFDSRYIGLINPVNFAYYAKYTIQELIVIPILVLAQKMGKIQSFVSNAAVHQYDKAIVQYKYFYLMQKKGQISNNNTNGNTSICFVSYTSNPHKQQYLQLTKYLKSLSQLNLTNTKTSIIIFLPYKPQNFNTTMFKYIINYIQKLKKLNNIQRVKLIIKPNKTVSSLSVYQSVHTYCTDQSIIVSSRHNIKYNPNFVQYLIKQTGNKIGVFATNFINQEKRKVKFQPLSKLKQGPKQSQIKNQLKYLYEKYFYAVQIFHQHLLKNAYFWELKSKEIDFYQSQASFVNVLLQAVQMQVHAINLTLYTVSQRFHSQTQLLQYRLILKHKLLPSIKMHAQSYNGLQNIAFKRHTTNKINKKIHIISLNQNSIKVKQRLKQLKTTNPDFSTKVWNKQNITPLNFPLSYKYIAKLFSYDSKSTIIQTIASKIITYEILYNYGGICISSQIKILRSLQQFLKYQLILTSIYTNNTNSTETNLYLINQTIIGSTQYNYYLHIILIEIITYWQSLQLNDNNINLMNNNSLISKAINDEQFFTNVGFGFHLFYLDSKQEYQLYKLLCAKKNMQDNQNSRDKACSEELIPYALVQQY